MFKDDAPGLDAALCTCPYFIRVWHSCMPSVQVKPPGNLMKCDTGIRSKEQLDDEAGCQRHSEPRCDGRSGEKHQAHIEVGGAR